MALEEWYVRAQRQRAARSTAMPRAPTLHELTVSRQAWREAAVEMAAAGGRLLAHWASRPAGGADVVHAAYHAPAGVLVVSLGLTPGDSEYPGIEDRFPCANRMQRAVTDLCGLR